jgi:hypothetical protein
MAMIRVDDQAIEKIKKLAEVNYRGVGAQVTFWADEAWEQAKKDGLVTDAMIQSADKPSPSEKKSRAVNARQQTALVA